MIAAVTLDPTLPLQSGHNLSLVGFGLSHDRSLVRKYWRTVKCQSEAAIAHVYAATAITAPDGLRTKITASAAMMQSVPAKKNAGR
jgi:hypothetical protein